MFTLKIDDTGNAAFTDGNASAECVRILRETADKLEAGKDHGKVYDINGNPVGTWDFCEPEIDEDEES